MYKICKRIAVVAEGTGDSKLHFRAALCPRDLAAAQVKIPYKMEVILVSLS